MDEQGMAALLAAIDRLVRNQYLSDAEVRERLRRMLAEAGRL